MRKLCDTFGNLSDEQIKAVAERRGVVGLNFLCFMIDEDIGKSALERLLDHADYIVDLCGIDYVGLDPDFADYYVELLKAYLRQHGYPIELAKYVEDVSGVTGMTRVAEGLSRRGCGDDQIQKIMGENFLRVYRQLLP